MQLRHAGTRAGPQLGEIEFADMGRRLSRPYDEEHRLKRVPQKIEPKKCA